MNRCSMVILPVSEFLGAGVQSTAGAAGGVTAGRAVILRGEVEVLKAIQLQIEVRNGDLLRARVSPDSSQDSNVSS